jgi:membrane protease YdiL (CAAX protease family)
MELLTIQTNKREATMTQKAIDPQVGPSEEHTFLQSIGLHLLPGILGAGGYFALANPVEDLGYPSILALILAGVFIITPVQLGILFYQSRKNNKKLFGEVILYLDPLPWKDYLVWVPVIFLSSGLIMALFGPVTKAASSMFNWLPETMVLDMGLSGIYPINKLITTYIFFFLFAVLIGPLTEEIYFRGYLLPRMPAKMQGWGPILHSILFAAYHLWTPWVIFARSFALLPLIYTVKYKRNLILGSIAHCLLNSIDWVIGIVFIINNI